MSKTFLLLAPQNNSGGHFIIDEDVNQSVIVESKDRESAEEKMEDLLKGKHAMCECCGPRWEMYPWEEIDSDHLELIKLKEVVEDKYEANCVVHFIDGEKKQIVIQDIWDLIADEHN